MVQDNVKKLVDLIEKNEEELLDDWIKEQSKAETLRTDLKKKSVTKKQSAKFIKLLLKGCKSGNLENIKIDEWFEMRDFLEVILDERAEQGFSTSETIESILSFKKPLFSYIQKEYSSDPSVLGEMIWNTTTILDKLGIYATEVFQESREEIITQQQKEIQELSTPVIKLWEGVLAVPLIGTLDSERTQVVMENLLQRITDDGSDVVIIDITGVPAIDTQTAQHLIKTVSATRLMGAECILSGVSPDIAQTIVSLGIDFDMITKSSLADALEVALDKIGLQVTK